MGFLKRGIAVAVALVLSISIYACHKREKSESKEMTSISAQDAKKLMEENDECLILDVRTDEEYDQGHIKNAVLIPDYEIAERAEQEITDKDRMILVYCRSGRRSKNAAQELADMGYTAVYEFGGIIDWPYDIEK